MEGTESVSLTRRGEKVSVDVGARGGRALDAGRGPGSDAPPADAAAAAAAAGRAPDPDASHHLRPSIAGRPPPAARADAQADAQAEAAPDAAARRRVSRRDRRGARHLEPRRRARRGD